MLNLSQRKLYDIEQNNNISISIEGSQIQSNIQQLNDLMNDYLKSVLLPETVRVREEYQINQINFNIPLYKQQFMTTTIIFYYHPMLFEFFKKWFHAQFSKIDGVPLVMSLINDRIYHTVVLNLNNKIRYILKGTFLLSFRVFDTINVHDTSQILELSVDLLPNWITVRGE